MGAPGRFDGAASTRTYTLMGADFFSTLVLPRLFERVPAEALSAAG
ncbi:hypothetical protein [Caulobacter sp. 17J80-11]|nr:hypothetical protein [Caulobacter sp. 17J80-11]MBC6981940.1 hypothetical protein [Caulobacter sp. 17J80-11]